MRERIGSASQIPSSQPRPSASLSHIPSQQLIDQQHTWIEHVRQVHAEERALWAFEREELRKTIKRLESVVHLLSSAKGSAVASPTEPTSIPKRPFDSFPARLPPRTSSLDAPSNGLWRGSGVPGGFPPTLHYVESRDPTHSMHHLSSISEKPHLNRKKSVGFDISRPLSPPNSGSKIAPISGDSIDASLDGISFKPSGLPPSLFKSVITPNSQSPSPTHRSVSPLARSPPLYGPAAALEPKPVILALPRASFNKPDELLTAHAGHTPMSRINDDASDASTPKLFPAPEQEQQQENEVPPLDPPPSHAPPARPPNERAESYFPVLSPTSEEEDKGERDEDPALKPPLALPSDAPAGNPERGGFLSSLDHKLLQAQRSQSEEELAKSSRVGAEIEAERGASSTNAGSESAHQGGGADAGSEDDSDEPKLKIKRSMNFGSQFGTLR